MIRMGGKAIVVGCLAAGVGFAGPDAPDPSPVPVLNVPAVPAVDPAPAGPPAASLKWAATRADGPTWAPASTPAAPAAPAGPRVASEPSGPAIVVPPIPAAEAKTTWQPLPKYPAVHEPILQPAPLSLVKPAQTEAPAPVKPEPAKPEPGKPEPPKPETLGAPRPMAPAAPAPTPAKPSAASPESAKPQPAQPKADATSPPAPSRPLLAAEDLPPPPPTAVWGAAAPAPCPAPVPAASFIAPPVRHGTFGSPDLAVSRDYHFLDFFCPGLFGDGTDTVVLGEGPAADRSFVQAEYLLWWVKAGEVPVLASTSTNGGFGFLGQPDTRVLLGPGRFGSTSRNGFRVRAGHWFGDDCAKPSFGVDGSFFFLGRRSDGFAVGSDQFPVITRPVFAPNFNAEFGELVAYPGISTGTLQVAHESRLWGADVNLRRAVCRTCDARKEWFAGYRHLSLDEELGITETITAAGTPNDPPGTRIRVTDLFETENRFHGGQVGWAAGRTAGRWDFDVRASVALGVSHQELRVAGAQVRTRPGGQPQTFTGGLLATGPNLGRFERNEFAVVPEATVSAGYRLTPGLRAYVGYNFLYWSSVMRPGEQIDRVVDVALVPNGPPVPPSGANRPQPTFQQSGFWTQGVQFGLEYRW